MKKDSKIYVAGHTGLVGSAIVRKLLGCGYKNIITAEHSYLDLTDQNETENFFAVNKPEYVFLAAAMVGGIYANNTFPGQFIYSNLQIELNIINSAKMTGVKKLCFLGSSCIYPRFSLQPIREDFLLTGQLEPTNEAYAIAKIAGIKMCQAYNKEYKTDFISVMPTNVYGPGDNYDLKTSHVLPALIRRIHEAKTAHAESIKIWGTGTPLREFIHSDDLADACVYLMVNYSGSDIINIGTGVEVSINELVNLICRIVGYTGVIDWDKSMPDGMPRKLLDCTKLKNIGWFPKITIENGIAETYKKYCEGAAINI